MLFRSIRELLGIVLFRFRPIPRVWAIVLILVNLASVFFLDTVYGQVALAAMCVGAGIIVAIHKRLGFVRLLGVGHVLWIPMIVWFMTNPPEDAGIGWLMLWLELLIVCNSISLVIDTIDVVRYICGEREPFYVWESGTDEAA